MIIETGYNHHRQTIVAQHTCPASLSLSISIRRGKAKKQECTNLNKNHKSKKVHCYVYHILMAHGSQQNFLNNDTEKKTNLWSTVTFTMHNHLYR